MFELKDKGWYSVEKDLVHNAKYFENRGSRNMEAVNVWYFVSHIMKPLSRHVYVITTKFNYFDFYLWKIEKITENPLESSAPYVKKRKF